MTIPMITFAVVYMAVTFAYLFSETSGDFKRRAINKIGLASMFFLYSVFETIRLGSIGDIQNVALVGVTLSFLGDVLLLWSFMKGGTAFGIGNVVLFIYEILYFKQCGLAFSDYWWFLIIFAVLIGGFCYLWFGGWYGDTGKFKFAFVPYILTVTLHGTLGITGLFLLDSSKSILLCAGLVLFMISDYFISLHKFKFKKSKEILRLNSLTYFTGLLLVALSFSF